MRDPCDGIGVRGKLMAEMRWESIDHALHGLVDLVGHWHAEGAASRRHWWLHRSAGRIIHWASVDEGCKTANGLEQLRHDDPAWVEMLIVVHSAEHSIHRTIDDRMGIRRLGDPCAGEEAHQGMEFPSGTHHSREFSSP